MKFLITQTRETAARPDDRAAGRLLVGLRAPGFPDGASLANLLTDSTLLIMLALTQMLVIVTRGIDLSVASNLALSGMVAAMLGAAQSRPAAALVVLGAMLVGLALGLVNGWLIGYLALPPIVITLGTMSVYRGLVFVLSGGAWVSAHQMPAAFVAFPLTRVLGLPHLVWIAAAALLAMAWVARHTRFGRDLYAIGNAPQCAGYIGIPTGKRLLWTYGLSGAGGRPVRLPVGGALCRGLYRNRLRLRIHRDRRLRDRRRVASPAASARCWAPCWARCSCR
jgi:rhamnose transport system permease protein